MRKPRETLEASGDESGRRSGTRPQIECDDTPAAHPRDRCVHELFEDQAEHSPDSVAAAFRHRRVTYRELNVRANRLAHALRELGVGPETRVGLCLERSLDLVVAVLGVLKAGGAYVPLDPTYPSERLSFLIEDSGAAVLVTHADVTRELPSTRARLLRLDAQPEALTLQRDENPSSGLHPANLAYLIYTSGSTGTPKGVSISHRSLVSCSRAVARKYRLGSQDRVLQFASLSFDVAAEELFPSWLCGATVVLRTEASTASFTAFQDFLREQEVSVLNLPSSFWREWLSELSRSRATIPPSLRCIVVGSEKVFTADCELWQELAGDRVRFYNAYGTSETTITTTVYESSAGRALCNGDSVPIGRPLANAQVHVLDPHLNPTAVGVPGELYIGGDGLARGYHHRPETTAEKFLPNPFAVEPGSRLYRTGDRARTLTDGNLELLGRLDDQVKVRGFRVELGEIEAALARDPGVREAAVVALEPCHSPSPDQLEPDALCRSLASLEESARDALLGELERMSHEEAERRAPTPERDPGEAMREVVRRSPEFAVSLRIHDDFLRPPRESQRNWILQRTLDEFADDVRALDQVSRRFVVGSERPRIEGDWSESKAEYDPTQLVIENQQVMQDWERPLMQAMARVATASHGDVLEVGFGMGISASYIQEFGARSHSIIECNDDVAEAFRAWRGGYPDRDIRLIPGKWQDVADDLGSYDAILFDTYPLDEEEFVKNVIESINFAEHFFPTAARCLRHGGIFTYYSNEIDSFSRRHQRLLFEYFSSFTLSVVRPLSPPEDNNYWWADSMVVVEAKK